MTSGLQLTLILYLTPSLCTMNKNLSWRIAVIGFGEARDSWEPFKTLLHSDKLHDYLLPNICECTKSGFIRPNIFPWGIFQDFFSRIFHRFSRGCFYAVKSHIPACVANKRFVNYLYHHLPVSPSICIIIYLYHHLSASLSSSLSPLSRFVYKFSKWGDCDTAVCHVITYSRSTFLYPPGVR